MLLIIQYQIFLPEHWLNAQLVLLVDQAAQVVAQEFRQHFVDHRHVALRLMQPGTKEAVFPLNTGDVVITWPGHISADEIEDVENWMELMIRKMKRSTQASLPSGSDADSASQSESAAEGANQTQKRRVLVD